MTNKNELVDINQLFSHWMNELETNDHYKELTKDEIERIQHNSKDFLARCIKSTPELSNIDPNAIKPLLEFLRNIRKVHEGQGLSIRDTTLLTLSLKSSLNEFMKSIDRSNPLFDELNHLLDMFSILSFELYSNEQESLVDQQAKQIKYLQTATNKAFGTLIGQSNAMKIVYQAIGLVLENDVTVLLQGESGTGKDMVASAIHNHSNRKNKPFIAINCGAIPDNLIESELFGHEKGAFTGAEKDRVGKFELANNGTLFLDEISELSLNQQTKLLRVIQNQEVQRIGSNKTIPINVRIIAASNKPLEQMVDKKEFRMDLFYRINVFPIHIPKLVDRENDVILLANHFIEKYAQKLQVMPSKLTHSAMVYLQNQPWQGNIRELENSMQRAVIIANGKPITDAILSFKPGQAITQPLLSSGKTENSVFIPQSLNENEEAFIRKTLDH
ncbi:MAG: sigma-54 dependent transcriptional regulator, partial [Candidatus Margulisiibacteriota bacterium]|nr:sigma-54 dependent transcriptional regulator [Candidatus Margulisiibacteriota bacterium]